MNKNDFISTIQEKVGGTLTKKDIAAVVDAYSDVVADTLKSGNKIQLIGFGTFEARKRAAREGKNPQTGEPLKIAAATVPAFKAGKALKDAVN
jgi:DNA-binding protein HU-beta